MYTKVACTRIYRGLSCGAMQSLFYLQVVGIAFDHDIAHWLEFYFCSLGNCQDRTTKKISAKRWRATIVSYMCNQIFNFFQIF
jgi:hypothetical protein